MEAEFSTDALTTHPIVAGIWISVSYRDVRRGEMSQHEVHQIGLLIVLADDVVNLSAIQAATSSKSHGHGEVVRRVTHMHEWTPRFGSKNIDRCAAGGCACQ